MATRSGGGPSFGNAMMNNFTPRARQLLGLARKEAERFNDNYVGTEHLLLVLIKLGQCVAVHVLQNIRLRLEKVRLELEEHVGPQPAPNLLRSMPSPAHRQTTAA